MNKRIFVIIIIISSASIMFSGCATSHDPQQSTTQNADQNNGPTVSGYISVGGAKTF